MRNHFLQSMALLSAKGDEHLNVNGIDVLVSTHTQPSDSSSGHDHEHTNLVFLLAGGCLEKRQATSFERKVGDVSFLHAGERHETILAQWPTQYVSLEIAPAVFDRYELSEQHLLRAMVMTPDTKFLLLKMYKEVCLGDEYSADTIQMLFLQLASLAQAIYKRPTPPPWLSQIHQLLQDQWDQPVSLADLATVTGVHPVTISKQFPLYFGCTLGTYRRKLKIERSLFLIRADGQSLVQATYRCQFADQSHFIRNFKQFTGLLPSHYQVQSSSPSNRG